MRIYIDGGVRSHQRRVVRRGSICVVVSGSPPMVREVGNVTNNQAEYLALLEALRLAKERGYHEVEILSDSMLLVRQLSGEYKVRSPNVTPLYEEARRMLNESPGFRVMWIPREENVAGKHLE